MTIILASGSPRRQALLKKIFPEFRVSVPGADETMDPAQPPEKEVEKVSRRKALAVARGKDDLVIAADTIVVCGGVILGKPGTRERAEEMLRLLSGRTHQVMTGCTFLRGGNIHSFTEVTHVRFRKLSEEEISRYAATGEPLDKAGAYAIQGGAGAFVEGIEGDYDNVVGLPLYRVREGVRAVAPEAAL